MTQPDVRRGTILWPNDGDPNNIHAVQRAAQQEAEATVAKGEWVVDLQIGGGTAQQGNDSVMLWRYSYQVLGPGGSVGHRASDD